MNDFEKKKKKNTTLRPVTLSASVWVDLYRL